MCTKRCAKIEFVDVPNYYPQISKVDYLQANGHGQGQWPHNLRSPEQSKKQHLFRLYSFVLLIPPFTVVVGLQAATYIHSPFTGTLIAALWMWLSQDLALD